MSKNLHLFCIVMFSSTSLHVEVGCQWQYKFTCVIMLEWYNLQKVFCQVTTIAQWPRYIFVSVIRYYSFSHCGSVVSSILLIKVKKMHDEWCHLNVSLLPVLFCNWKFRGQAAGLLSADKLVLLCSEKWMNWSYLYYCNELIASTTSVTLTL